MKAEVGKDSRNFLGDSFNELTVEQIQAFFAIPEDVWKEVDD